MSDCEVIINYGASGAINYTATYDGFLTITLNTNSADIRVNNVFMFSVLNSGQRQATTLPVIKGDVVTSDAVGAYGISARYYKKRDYSNR